MSLSEKELREIFASKLENYDQYHWAFMVRNGVDTSYAGRAAIEAMIEVQDRLTRVITINEEAHGHD